MKKALEYIFEKYGLSKSSDKSSARLMLIKWELAKLFGGKCERCGEADLRVLTFHHKKGGMSSDEWRHMSRKKRYDNIRTIIDSGRPEDVELLCTNCHTKDFSYPKLGNRSNEFLSDIRRFRRTRAVKVTGLPDGLMVLDSS